MVSESEVNITKHNLSISVSKNPQMDGVVTCKNIDIRERILRLLFGNKQRVTILIPGDSVDEVAINEIEEGGGNNG